MRRVTRSQAGHGADKNTPLSDSPVSARRGQSQVRSVAVPPVSDNIPADNPPHSVPDPVPADDPPHLTISVSDLTMSC